jgi:hypothetical protein
VSFYLLTHANRHRQQYREGRRGTLTGGVLLHTTESPRERGAQPIAHWIATQRTDHGSYHCIVDSDSAVPMMPDHYTAYHCGEAGYNSRTWGISFACRTTDLDVNSEWTRSAMKFAAREIVAFWKRNGFDPMTAARFIPAIQTQSSPGMSTHGEAQPRDRSDAWTRHPQRAGLEALLLVEMAKVNGSNPEPEDDDMKQVMIRDDRTGAVWNVCGNTRYKLEPPEVELLSYLGVQLIDRKGADNASSVTWLRSCKDLGRESK